MNAAPEKLQYLATKSVCVELVYEWADKDTIPVVNMWKDKNQDLTCSDHDWFLWQLYEMQIPEDLVIPTPIKNQIEDTITSILDPIRTWVRYHHVINYFHEGEVNSLKPYIKSLVWTKDYKIDYTATAKKISSNKNLRLMERFRFACVYCVVEDLENFSAVANIIKELNFTTEPFMVYWSKYLTNELDTLSDVKVEVVWTSLFKNSPLEVSQEEFEEARAGMAPSLKDSVEGILFEQALMSYELWPPVEYFFTKLSPAIRIRRFNSIIEHCGKRDRKELLAKLTDEQWIAAGKHSIRNLIVLNLDYIQDVRYIWSQFKDEMNSKNFCDMIEELISLSLKNPTNFDIWTPFLIEIWNSVSDEFKRAATDLKLWREVGGNCLMTSNPFEEKSDFCSRRQVHDPMKFIRLVVSYMDAKSREIFFQENFFWLIIWQPFESLSKLLKEFRVPRNVVKFKQELKESSEVVRSLGVLLAFAEFEEFDKITSFCLSGKNDKISVSHQYLVQYKWAIIVPPSGMDLMSLCLFFIDWKNLFEYVKKTLQNIDIPPVSYIITLFELGCIRYHVEEKIYKGETKDIMECLSTILSSTDPRLPELKSRLRSILFKCLFDFKFGTQLAEIMNFKCADIQNFLSWLYNGDQALIEKNFRNPHLFRKGFLIQFKTCCHVEQRIFEVSDSMEEFLKWCFSTEEERRKFKRYMIRHYQKYDMIKDVLWWRRFRRRMLSWFFEDDTKLINEFLFKYVTTDKSEPEKVADSNEAEKEIFIEEVAVGEAENSS